MAEASITKRALGEAFKKLLKTKKFSKISIGEICELCGINRKSFYYHFHDKYELVIWIFESEFISRVQKHPDSLWKSAKVVVYYVQDLRNKA